jgi:hypothetical protein
MSTAVRQHRAFLGLSACLMGLAFILSAMLGPLSLYRCRMEGEGLSVQQHRCCASRNRNAVVRAERGACCERVKAATPPLPALVSHILPQLERLWTPAWTVLFVQPRLEPPLVAVLPPVERGPPERPRTPPVFLLNASFLC